MTMPFTTPIIISPIGENGWHTIWKVIEPLNFHSDKFGKNYVVPAGTLTDLKSGLRRDASAAAIVHDHLYNWGVHFKQIKDREEADQVFFEAMESSGVKRWRAWLYFLAVRLFGWRYYKPGEVKMQKKLLWPVLLLFFLSGCTLQDLRQGEARKITAWGFWMVVYGAPIGVGYFHSERGPDVEGEQSPPPGIPKTR